ncbi:MAG TPA: hypothetical protein VHO06_20700 [Polyangia bacterium]|nr:hypothetical protein [Polyangia bacterium]
MKIYLRYKRIGQEAFEAMDLRPDEYFEALDEDRPFEWDDVPEKLHAVEHLPIPAHEVSEWSLRILENGLLRLRVDSVLWNGGENWFLRKNAGDLDLIIVVLQDAERWHIARFNLYDSGSILFEQVGVMSREGREVSSPSRVLELPAAPLPIGTEPRLALIARSKAAGDWRGYSPAIAGIRGDDPASYMSLLTLEFLLPAGAGGFDEAQLLWAPPDGGAPRCLVYECRQGRDGSRVIEHFGPDRQRTQVDLAPPDLQPLVHTVILERSLTGGPGLLRHIRREGPGRSDVITERHL